MKRTGGAKKLGVDSESGCLHGSTTRSRKQKAPARVTRTVYLKHRLPRAQPKSLGEIIESCSAQYFIGSVLSFVLLLLEALLRLRNSQIQSGSLRMPFSNEVPIWPVLTHGRGEQVAEDI